MSKEPDALCGETTAKCVCVKPAGHVEQGDGVHLCDSSCGGAWRMVNGEWRVVEFPGMRGLAKALGLS